MKSCYKLLETYLKHDDSYDFNDTILFEELKIVREILRVESKSSYMILISLTTLNCFSNAYMTYRIILLIIHVIVVSSKRTFFSNWNC